MNYIGKEFDLNELYSQAFGYVGPPFPAGGNVEGSFPTGPFGTIDALVDQYKKTLVGTEMVMPLSWKIPGQELWEMEMEPMIGLRGANKIIRRYPNQNDKGGSIKERWCSDDYNITIKGVLFNQLEAKYPEAAVKKLRAICEYKNDIMVENPLFRIFGIERISIRNFDIPPTPGLTVQAFSISAYSDYLFDGLLLEV